MIINFRGISILVVLLETGLFQMSCLITAFLESALSHDRNGDWNVDCGSGLLPDHSASVACSEYVGGLIDLSLHLLLLPIFGVKWLGVDCGIFVLLGGLLN